MTELPSSDNKRTSRPWLLQTFGLAFGVSVAMVAIVFVGLLALESSSSRRVTTAQAAPAQVIAAVTPEPTATEAPTATAVPTEPATLAPTATSLPTQTPLPTATATPLPTATVKTVARSVVAAPKSTTPVARRSAATVTATPVPSAFDVSFYVKAWCGTRKIQTLQFMITGHGGQPPYDYYNDSTLLAKGEFGSVKYTFDAPSGNPVPVKLIVLDSAGHRFVQDMFYKTHLKCGGL